MAIKHLTYFDIPQDIRTEAAAKVRYQLRTSLANPAYTEEQRQEIVKTIGKLSAWEAGTLPIEGLPPPASKAPARKFPF